MSRHYYLYCFVHITPLHRAHNRNKVQKARYGIRLIRRFVYGGTITAAINLKKQQPPCQHNIDPTHTL